MSIGSTIKHLRREKNITQEQLAEYLGITSRAVSQWECDRTAPDISQLPALCHIFHVSSDTLLGIDMTEATRKSRIIWIRPVGKCVTANLNAVKKHFVRRYGNIRNPMQS